MMAAKAGLMLVTINPVLQVAEVEFILKQRMCRRTLRLMMLYVDGHSAWRKNATGRDLLKRVEETICPCFSVKAATHIRKAS